VVKNKNVSTLSPYNTTYSLNLKGKKKD